MAWAAKTYTFSPSTTIASAQVNQNFDDMVNGLDTAMPSGGIIIWSGAIGSIPSGWYLCNGANSTPDLRDRFVLCAGSTYSVGSTGGAATHTHTYSGTTASSGVNQQVGSDNEETSTTDHTHTYSGTTDSGSALPPYYVLAYIMKS